MSPKSTDRSMRVKIVLALVANLILPSCSQADQAEPTQPAATGAVQVAQSQPAPRASGASAGGGQPNILLVFMDNFGWGEPGFNGGGIIRGAATPRLDRLAEEGLRLTK